MIAAGDSLLVTVRADWAGAAYPGDGDEETRGFWCPESLMVASPGFAEAIQHVRENKNPTLGAARAEHVMGSYYPRAGTCPLSPATEPAVTTVRFAAFCPEGLS
jgi:hypothetical protein